MKNKKFHLCVLLFILFSLFSLNSQELSNSVFRDLKKHKSNPITQQLVNGGVNNFPYNIYLQFNNDLNTDKNLVLIFFQEQFQNHQTEIENTLNFIKEMDFEFKTTVLFSYGNKQQVNKPGMIFGSQVFIDNINTNEDYTILIFDFDRNKSQVISHTQGLTAPSWLIKNEYQAFLENGLKKNVPDYYLSQIYKFSFYSDSILPDFLTNDIPGIKVEFSKETEPEQINNIIQDSILNYAHTSNRLWDHHFIIFRHFDSYIIFSEAMIIRIIIFIIFSWLSYIIILIFINTRQKHLSWRRVKYIWWAIPGTYLLTYAGFIAGKLIYKTFITQNLEIQQIFTLTSIQIFISLILVSIFYLLVLLFNNNFEPKSVDYLITICCFINQSIFILVDISLFPIFMFICILSILAQFIKNNILHIIVFILMIFPFIPYIHTVITTSDLELLRNYLFTSPYVPLAMSSILYAIYLVYFRILSSFRTKLKKITTNFITVSLSASVLIAVILLVFFVRTSKLINTNQKNQPVLIHKPAEDLIEFNYSDTPIFKDTIRTIYIKIHGKPLQCDVTLWSTNQSPVLYSNNDYENTRKNSVYFKIPDNPPENMIFSYGASEEPCTILITAIFATEEENVYEVAVKTEHVGEDK